MESNETITINGTEYDVVVTRHDIPAQVKEVIRTAVAVNAVDALDIYALGIEHGQNWNALVTELVEIAFSNIHWDKSQHDRVAQAADKCGAYAS